MGAGAVGTEMATVYSSFGAKVTLISASLEILPAVDRHAGSIVRRALQSRGVLIIVGVRVTAVQRQTDDNLCVELSNGRKIHGSELLLPAGRKGKHDELNLQSVRVQISGKWIPVDDALGFQTVDGNWLYAVGDVNERALLTHTSKYHGRIVANAIIARSEGAEDARTD